MIDRNFDPDDIVHLGAYAGDIQRANFSVQGNTLASEQVLEAMATGLPVVATEVGGNPEIVTEGETGYLVPAGNAQALYSALLTLIESPEKRLAMRRLALSRIKARFEWGRTVAGYLGVYDELLGGTSLDIHRLGSGTPTKKLGTG